MKKSTIKILFSILTLVIILPIATYTTIRFGLSKDNISYPAKDHSHLRLKYIFQGQEEDFGSPRYQTEYTKDICSGDLTTSPLHFHDNKTDYQHQHWARMTGGQFLKFYGYNLIGGLDGYMGFELDKLPKVIPVPIYANNLPKPRANDSFWVYTGLEDHGKWDITKKNWQDFVNQDFETFLGKESQVRLDQEKYGFKSSLENMQKILNKTNLKTQAHVGIEHETLDEEQKHNLETKEASETEARNNQQNNQTTNQQTISSSTELASNPTETQKVVDPITGEELKSINNLLGDIVIFVQKEEPTNEQIQSRFQKMVKLDKSSCGG
jgi:hypothetical protein